MALQYPVEIPGVNNAYFLIDPSMLNRTDWKEGL